MHALTIPLPDAAAPRSRAVPVGAADARVPAERNQAAGREARADFAAQMGGAEARPTASHKGPADGGGARRLRAGGEQADAGVDPTPLAAHPARGDEATRAQAPRGPDLLDAAPGAPAAASAPADLAPKAGADLMPPAAPGTAGGAPTPLSASSGGMPAAVASATPGSDPARDAVATGAGAEHRDIAVGAAAHLASSDPRSAGAPLGASQRFGRPGDGDPDRDARAGRIGSTQPQVAAGRPPVALDATPLPAHPADGVKADRTPPAATPLPEVGVTVTARRVGGARPTEPPADWRPLAVPAAPGEQPEMPPGEARAAAPTDAAPEHARPGPAPATEHPDSGGRRGIAMAIEPASPAPSAAGQANAAVASGTPAPAAPAAPVPGVDPASAAVSASRQIAAAAIADPQADRIELRLDPPELGRVEIRLEFADDGLRAIVAAERGSTADLLRRHGDVLTQHLREAGFGDVDLGFGNFGGDGRTKDQAQGIYLPAPRPGGAEEDARHEPPWRAADAFAAGRARSADRAFDMKV